MLSDKAAMAEVYSAKEPHHIVLDFERLPLLIWVSSQHQLQISSSIALCSLKLGRMGTWWLLRKAMQKSGPATWLGLTHRFLCGAASLLHPHDPS